MKKKWLRLLVALIVVLCVWVYQHFDLASQLNLETLKAKQQALEAAYQNNQWSFLISFFILYVLATTFSFPGASFLTLGGGAVFGFSTGLILVSFASSLGATGACYVSRIFLRSWLSSKFPGTVNKINRGIEKDGKLYLLSLRLLPIFPFWMINLCMGLTKMPLRSYYWVSQLGMLPGTAVYVNAGTQLSKIEKLSDVGSPQLLFSFALLGLFPWIAKAIMGFIKNRKILSAWKKPKNFDYNLLVIGGGSAGLVSAYIASAVKAKVALVEKAQMGGDCLNTGCVPSKALIKSAKVAHQSRNLEKYGLSGNLEEVDFQAVMARVSKIIKKIEPHDSIERYSKLGVDCLQGEAKLLSPWQVQVGDKKITAKKIIIASGATPLIPPIPGLAECNPLSSDNLWQIKEKPKNLLVLGGGPIGCELSQAFSRLGCKVTQVEMGESILPREDPEVAQFMQKRFKEEDISLLLSHKAQRFENRSGSKFCIAQHEGKDVEVPFDQVIVAIGRRARVKGFGLEELGVELNSNGTIAVDEYLRTRIPTLYACGDVAGPFQFTHTAAHQAWFASVNSLFGGLKKFKVDYSTIPWCTYTDPEIARVGLSQTEATQKGIPHQVSTYDLSDLDRAITEDEDHGFVKVITKENSDRILGVTIVGARAGDYIAEFVSAMKHRIGLNKILGTIHIYPTFAEANKYVAGNWKRSQVSPRLMSFLEKFHSWNRS